MAAAATRRPGRARWPTRTPGACSRSWRRRSTRTGSSRHDPGMDSQRLDTWLWVARLSKTRSLANDAIAGGRVQVDGQRAKPSRAVKPGDRVEITIAPAPRTVIVRG